jgi:hypothetical protein
MPQKISLDDRIDRLANAIHKANLDIHVASILRDAAKGGSKRKTKIEMDLEKGE